MPSVRVDELLRAAAAELAETSPTPRLDAELLLSHRLGCQRSRFLAWPEAECPESVRQGFHDAVNRRRAGMPVVYLIGHCGFWSLELEITQDVLIPRPETELLVALAAVRTPNRGRILEPGTGSGAIAIAIARECPASEVIASDNSRAAVRLAQRNARHCQASVGCIVADWLAAFSDNAFDVVVSNPPYIAPHEPELTQGDVRFEPADALVSPPDGLAAIRQLVGQAPRLLVPGGWLILEHGWQQGGSVRAALADQGLRAIATHHDLAGHERATLAQRP